MDFFGRLNARVVALAQNTLGGILSKVDRLDDWTAETPPERTDYAAIWREVIAPVHPILDARVEVRTVERNTDRIYANRETPFTRSIDALTDDAKAALAVEALKRSAFLDYCLYFNFNRGNSLLTSLGNFGLPREALTALKSDLDLFAGYIFGRSRPRLDAQQTASVARIVGSAAGGVGMSFGQYLACAKPVLCVPDAATDEKKRLALLHLFTRLGESERLIAYPDPSAIAFVDALASALGISPETHPIVRAQRAKEALAEEARQAVLTLGGPHLKQFFEQAYRDKALDRYVPHYVKGKAEEAGLGALSPAERGQALFHCLRVFNFSSQCSRSRSSKAWPDCKLSSLGKADYSRMGDHVGRSGLLLPDLFQNLARRKVELDEEMQCELLLVLRSGVADYLVRSLQVVKIVEGFAKQNSSARVRRELEATIAWLRGVGDHHGAQFKAAALHRLEKALATMAVPAGPTAPVQAPSEAPKPVAGLRLPGGFGRRTASPTQDPVAAAWPGLVRPPEEARLDPPKSTDPHDRSKPTIAEFYGDLGDLRKCSAEHIAFLDELIRNDADPEAELRRIVAERGAALRAAGLTERQIDMSAALAALRVRGPAERDRFRELIETVKSRVQTVAGLSAPARSVWPAFHDHARALYGKSKPAAAWLKSAHAILDAIPVEEQVALVKALAGGYRLSGATHATADAVRGLVYCAAQLPASQIGTAIADFARKECFHTVPGVGIRDKRMGNACLWTLIHMPDGAGVPYLARLLNRIKYPSVKKAINAALDEAAAKAGMSRGTLDELSVPTHELDDGKRTIAIGPDGAAALLEIVGTADVSLAFRRADGKATASVPAELKAFKAEIREARNAAGEIEADLTTQIARLQRIWLERRDWSFADWDARYARHPLLSALTRRLIWDVGEGAERRAALLVDGALADLGGKPVDASESRISLWHPIGRPLPEVLGWRERLSALGIAQPFKQAHREVYYVTDAERATGIYSNRFAGHILRQHQMMTLARLNHWNVTHRIWADVRNDEPTHLVVPAWNIVAELWTEGAGGDTPEVADTQAYLYVSTNQVRFYNFAGSATVRAAAFGPVRGEAIRMEAVPDIVFSEVMRHCDLFTSVASVANDPNWIDLGAAAQHPDQWRRNVADEYWRNTALGDLNQSAATRKDVIAGLLPSLKIAESCEIDGNYLRVRGKLRTYRIHFGSGNILMEPDSRYICIVPATPKFDQRVMLPFEGETMLSLILSKALLLAGDDKINDQVIVRQIYR